MAIKRGNSEDSFEEQKTVDVVWYQQQMRALQGTIDILEGELESLRQQQGTVYVKDLETQLYETQRELMAAHRRNKRLTGTLQEAKENYKSLKRRLINSAHLPITMAFSSARTKMVLSMSTSAVGNGVLILIQHSKIKTLPSEQEVIVNSGMNVC